MLGSDIKVEAQVEYLPRFSDAIKQVFAYHMTITNNGEESVKILSRFWEITDGNEKTQHVKGEGVVGKKPTIAPGDSFEYSSSVAIDTDVGCMSGSYYGMTDAGVLISIPIELFTLQVPNKLN
ncbi:MAG: Co2+/Mg2+ efflux protein ApaG [Saccharospirillaceae bacterium]|nr:Co2+/Mg2+ efflux protein ApaG [Pseudomonadales bacterium]NRB80478.1 Co2+/Mg2+ efflux protein ApaG [Saccharospirillaceae bacterium]